VSNAARATELRDALIAETLDEVARLHDALQAIGPTLQAAVADAVAQGKKEVHEHVQAQTLFVEQAMLKDREQFTQAQKAALQELGEQLKNRDTWLSALMAEILKKGRAQFTAEMQQAAKKAIVSRQKQQRGMLFGMLLGMSLTLVGVIAAAWGASAILVCGQ
jgi:hypothetical protein